MDCFKPDFGQRIPTDVQWFVGSDPQKLHNHYAYFYNELHANVLHKTVGVDDADASPILSLVPLRRCRLTC
ncbi:hypothetical protein, partial [Salmonella enterica]|uniref:hypothetical protein n=1 Tax=Salmonella enterica TaxID=28901 RepID=UPI000B176DB1